MNINPNGIPSFIPLKEPVLSYINFQKNLFNSNSIEEESSEEKKNDKDSKSNSPSTYIINNIIPNMNQDISSKINIIINNDDILQEQKLLDSKERPLFLFSENENNFRKLIFRCQKRNHDKNDEKINIKDTCDFISQKIINKENIKNGGEKAKKPVYKKHDKMEKDNIVRKIQVHYCNFLVNFINEITQRIIIDESYKTENPEEIIHMKDYLLNNIDYRFKANIKKEFMELSENMKIKDIISPSHEFCKQYNINNKNEQIMKKIESKNNPILNKILEQKYLYYFNEIYFKNKRNIELKDENISLKIILSNNTKMLDDLISKNKDDKNYFLKMKRVVMQNFSKPKYMFKIKK